MLRESFQKKVGIQNQMILLELRTAIPPDIGAQHANPSIADLDRHSIQLFAGTSSLDE